MSLLLFLLIITVVVYALLRYGDQYRSFKDAYADEWFAYYQYWLAAGGCESTGPCWSTVLGTVAKKEFLDHANDELRHASMLAKYLTEHGQTPPSSPISWYKSILRGCGYKTPNLTDAKSMIQDALDGELCAIDVYTKMIACGPDDSLAMLHTILKDEQEHAADLRKLLVNS